MKKLLTLMAAMLLAAALSVSASAAESPEEALEAMPEGLSTDEKVEIIRETYVEAGYTDISEDPAVSAQSAEVPEKVRQLAYMDLEEADEETQAQILEARKAIIYTRSWRADDVILMNANPETMTLDIVPKFSDVFPGWDLPVEDVEDAPEEEVRSPISRSGWQVDLVYNADHYVPKSSTTSLAPTMCSVRTSSGDIDSITVGLEEDEFLPSSMPGINVGFSDAASGKSIGAKMNAITDTDSKWDIVINPAQYARVSVSVSTQYTPGYVHLIVRHSYLGDPANPNPGIVVRETLKERINLDIRENRIRQYYYAMGYSEKPEDISPVKEIPEDVLKTAKLDITSADEALKKKVLSTRRRVIYSYPSWTADDVTGISRSKNKDGKCFFSIQPKFHDLFPSDWDQPIG